MIRKLWCWIVGTGCQWSAKLETRIVDPRNEVVAIEWIDRCDRCGATRKRKAERT